MKDCGGGEPNSDRTFTALRTLSGSMLNAKQVLFDQKNLKIFSGEEVILAQNIQEKQIHLLAGI